MRCMDKKIHQDFLETLYRKRNQSIVIERHLNKQLWWYDE